MPFAVNANWVRFDLKVDSKRGAVDIFDSERGGNRQDYQMRFGGQWENMAKYWAARFNFDSVKMDYSHFLIRDEDGREVSLGDTFDENEYSSSVGFIYQKGRNSCNISLAKSLGNTPFPFFAGSLACDRMYGNKTRSLGLELSFADKERPESTYIEQGTFRQRKLPTEAQSWRGSVRWSEVVTDRWKVGMVGLYGVTSQERPAHYGLEIKNGLGLTHEILLKAHVGFIREQDGELENDRGLFDMSWMEWSFWWEVKPDYAIEGIYSFVKEWERYSLGKGDAILGTDSYGVKFNYEGLDWLFNVGWVFRNTNIHYQSHEIQGGIQWDI